MSYPLDKIQDHMPKGYAARIDCLMCDHFVHEIVENGIRVGWVAQHHSNIYGPFLSAIWTEWDVMAEELHQAMTSHNTGFKFLPD